MTAAPGAPGEPTLAAHGLSPRGAAWLRGAVLFLVVASGFSVVAGSLALALLLACVLVLRPRPPLPWRELAWVLAPFAALYAVGLLATLQAPAASPDWRPAVQHRLLLMPPLLLLALPVVSPRTLARTLGGLALCVGLYGLLQALAGIDPFYPGRPALALFGGVYRARGPFSHPLTYSGYLLLLAPLCAAMAAVAPGRWRWLWLGALAAALIGELVGLSRSGWFGLLAGGLVLLFGWRRRWGAVALLAAVALVVGLVLARPLLTAALAGRTNTAGGLQLYHALVVDLQKDASLRDRTLLWEAGLRGFLERPLLGYGVDTSNPALAPFQRAVVAEHGMPDYQFTVGYGAPLHNVYLRVLFEQGALGLIAYLGLWASVFVAIARGLRRLAPTERWGRALLWGLAAGLAASMAAGCFEDNFFDAEVQTILLVDMLFALHLARALPGRSHPAASQG